MIYFDGAATSYPKPLSVKNAVARAIELGGNPGRSGHEMSMRAAQAVYEVREKAAGFFDAEPENVIFTANCTHSLNLAIKGIAEPHLREGRKPHVIISSLEHNSVLRPVHELAKRGLSYSIAEASYDDDEALSRFEKLITPDTIAVISTIAGNVTGQLMPFDKIGRLCKSRGICFIADGAQACGVIPISIRRDCINILCMPGHKGLFGISGTGMLITDGSFPIYHIIEGGTGSTSLEPEQTPFLPEELESGTLNTVGIMSVGAGIDFINRVGIENIHEREEKLCQQLISRISPSGNVTVYRRRHGSYLPIVLFNIRGIPAEQVSQLLSDKGFALRGGLHCSPLGHRSVGTLPDGGVRFSPSCFNNAAQTELLAREILSLAK